jgi:hypothetical protein
MPTYPRIVAQWRPEKWAVRIGDSDSYLLGGRPPWWQSRKRRNAFDRAGRFNWREVRISFRRSEDQ